MTAMVRSFQPRLALGFSGEVQFELLHERGRHPDWWTIEIGVKRAVAKRRRAIDPAVTLHLTIAEFVRVFSGIANPINLWVAGQIQAEGDVLLGARLTEMFGGINPSEVLARVER
jgi:hypothetical protein